MVIADHSDTVEIYSIDESFFRLPTLANGRGNVEAAHRLREDVERSLGLPTRIGLGPTRTLSKVANALAKATEKVWRGVIDLHDTELRKRMMAELDVSEVWGCGSALTARLRPLGVQTAADLAALPPAVARDVGTVVLERLVRELNGIECSDFAPEPERLKGTAVTRGFGEPIGDRDAIREAMVRRAVRASEKIRDQGLVASRLIAFAHGSRYKPNAPSASRSAHLSPATHDPRTIAGIAGRLMDSMFMPGAIYTKCGVMLEGLHPQDEAQTDLFASINPKTAPLLAAIDGLNGRFGRHTIRLAAEGQGQRPYETKRERKSPAWTTRIAEIPVAR